MTAHPLDVRNGGAVILPFRPPLRSLINASVTPELEADVIEAAMALSYWADVNDDLSGLPIEALSVLDAVEALRDHYDPGSKA